MNESLSYSPTRLLRCAAALAFLMLFVLSPLANAANFPQLYIRDKQYRFADKDKDRNCRDRNMCYSKTVTDGNHHDYSMNFIEFRDNGELWDSAELDATLKQLALARQNKEPVTVFIYIHG